MFWLGKTIKKINGSCIAKHMQNEQYKHASGRKLQCGHARSGNQDSDASNTSLPVKCTSSITFSNLKKIPRKHSSVCVRQAIIFSRVLGKECTHQVVRNWRRVRLFYLRIQ